MQGCNIDRINQVAVMDTNISYRLIQQHNDQIQLCYLNLNQKNHYLQQHNAQSTQQTNASTSTTKTTRTHGEIIISEIIKYNPDVNILYFSVSTNSTQINTIDSDLVIKSLQIILESLYSNSKSIGYINISLGSIKSNKRVESLINSIAQQYTNIIISASSGNQGPWKGSLSFPSLLQTVISIGTTNLLSSKGPSPQNLAFPITKPNFIIDVGNGSSEMIGTSIACAQFTGYISKQNKQGHSKSILLIGLIQSSVIIDDYDIFEQGYGVLDLNSQLTFTQYLPFVYIFPSIIDLTQSNHYLEFVQDIALITNQSNLHYHTSINFTLLMLNVFNQVITLTNVYLRYHNSTCPIHISLFYPQFNEFTALDYLNLTITFNKSNNPNNSNNSNNIYNIPNNGKNRNNDRMENIYSCIFVLEFKIYEAFGKRVIKEREEYELVVKVKEAIVSDNRTKMNIVLNKFYQLDYRDEKKNRYGSNYRSEYYKDIYDGYGGSSLSNYSLLKRYYSTTYNSHSNDTDVAFFETHKRYEDMPKLESTLILIIDYETPLSQSDIVYLLAHLNQQTNSIAIFADWFFQQDGQQVDHVDQSITRAFEYQTINQLLQDYGVSFAQGSFSNDIILSHNTTIAYHSGSQIVIDHLQSAKLSKEIKYSKAFFQSDQETAHESLQEIIYFLELKTINNSKIYLFADSACLDDAFQHKNCYSLIDQMIDHIIAQTQIQNQI